MAHAIHARLNTALVAGFAALAGFTYFVLPLALLPLSPAFLFLLLPVALTSNTLWYLAHESFHMNLHPNKQANEYLGRVLAVCFGAPYDVVRFGHLQHHRFNGADFDRPELYHAETSSKPTATLSYYANILGGLYIGEFLAYLPLVLGKRATRFVMTRFMDEHGEHGELKKAALTALTKDDVIRKARIEATCQLLLLSLAFAAYGPYWPALLGYILLKGGLISFANNLPHYATPRTDRMNAYNVAMPTWQARFYLNFNHHHVHHLSPLTPWTALPAELAARGETFQISLADAAMAQFGGPVEAKVLPREG